MAFDGIMMTMVRRELEQAIVGARVNQVYQPARDELVFSFRANDGVKKLLLRLSDAPRVHLTAARIENPPTPPMMCMLLRKRLGGARLIAVEQPQSERILRLIFDAINEIGDRETLSLYIEIMGRYSNAILTDGEDRVIESMKRIDFSMSEDRVLLPKMPYELPRAQKKLCLFEAPVDEIVRRIEQSGGDDRAVLSTIQGISPIIAREVVYRTMQGSTITLEIERLKAIAGSAGEPTLVYREDGSPMDVAFMDITQYEGALKAVHFDSCGELLDSFYAERDRKARMKTKSSALNKLLSNAVDRLSRKINLQKADLKKCADREQLRIKGDLLQANLYRIEAGMSSVTVENYYDENTAPITIRLNPAISPARNAQKYYKEYSKAKTREIMLTEQIRIASEELLYLETVQDALSRAESEAELSQIRSELTEQGYIKAPKGKARRERPLPPLEYKSCDGFTILVGRNNRQNDQLTLKTAAKTDIWLHVKNYPGSHTILVTDGREPTEGALREAAQIAAYHSKAKDSSGVAVDYTAVKNVSKPSGAKPGRVIYVRYNTIYVTPKAYEV